MNEDRYTSEYDALTPIIIVIGLGFLEALADLITGVPL